MKFIDEVEIKNKTVLLRVDYNVSLNANLSIADDLRIRQSLPTIEHLLKDNNKLILISHFREPTERNSEDSLLRVKHRLAEYLPKYKIWFVTDFLKNREAVTENDARVILLENIRFYPGEMSNDPKFTQELAALGDVYVNDGFSVSHRKSASIVGLPKLLPSYGGLLLKKEITMLSKLLKKPKKPFVAIIGGKKITTKIKFIDKLATKADYLLLGGGLANTFIAAEGHGLGNSHMVKEEVAIAKHILSLARKEHTRFVLPKDAVVGDELDSKTSEVKKINEIDKQDHILDIGPETQAEFGKIISEAATIVWNGPVGYIENPVFKRGTDFLYYSLTENPKAVSVIGGGDTLAAITKKEYLDKITHISTGGGAMLEFIENGTLPGIEALK
ncbi:MAG TPA: phosphoglycerate kinase [Candidatus Saccharimonadales bacterium]|nr:phosphoglycerate kinase [Candidatus Saccharimonadales bacterium]